MIVLFFINPFVSFSVLPNSKLFNPIYVGILSWTFLFVVEPVAVVLSLIRPSEDAVALLEIFDVVSFVATAVFPG
jgi:hypothetical protein